MKKKIMILGAGVFQVPIIKKCNDMGLESYVVDYDPNAEGFEYAAKKLVISTLDKEKVLKAFIKNECDYIITTSDYPVRVVAYISEKMNVIGPSVEAATISTDKYLLRERLREVNLPCPKYYILKEKSDIENVIEDITFPLVMKPVDSSASRGVTEISNVKDLYYYYDKSLQYSKSGEIILEEFIKGREFSVECLIQESKTNIIAITEKTVDGYPFFVESRHRIPANISKTEEEEITSTVKKAIESIRLDNSAAHVELKLYDSKAFIIEIGPRLGGDYITSDLVPLATNIDMMKNIILIACGEKIDIDNVKNNNSAIQFITKNNIDIFLKNKNYILNNNIIVSKNFDDNRIIDKLESSFDRYGHIIVQSMDENEIEEFLNIFN